MLSEAENTAELVEPPTDAELETAITGNVAHLLTVVRSVLLFLLTISFTKILQMKAVNKFKKLVAYKRPPIISSILGEEDSSRFSQPPLSMQRDSKPPPGLTHKSHSMTAYDRQAVEGALVVEGVHRNMDVVQSPDHTTPDHHGGQTASSTIASLQATESARMKIIGGPSARSANHGPDPDSQPQSSRTPIPEEEEQYLAFRPEHSPPDSERARSYDEAGHRGHAHDPLQDHLYLYIGPSTFSGASGNADRRATFAADGEEDEVLMVSESPGAADIDIYETAYRDEIERIRQRNKEEGKDEEEPLVYLTRRVDARLLAVGQLAGRFMAMGEEGLDRFGSATRWKDKKAKVTDVSRALRAAAREEYEKRRQERLKKGRAASVQAAGAEPPTETNAATENQPRPGQREGSSTESAEGGIASSWTPSMFSQRALGGRAAEKGRQAKTSFKSLMGMMKDKSE